MASEHPFQSLFETFGRLPSAHAEPVNRLAYEKLWQVLSVGNDHAGRCILLKAPRAGHGKTHLLSRIQYNLGTEHEFIPLHAASGSFIDAGSVTADVLIRLSRPLPAGGGLCVLDLLVRKMFALALQPLVRSGEVPCQDREGALAALRNRPVETFDFHHSNAVTAHWARENFEVLGPRLALELAQRTGAPLREVMFWVDALFRFAATSVDHPSRAGSLIQAVTSVAIQPAQVFERLGALLGMLTQLVRIVLVADDLEGFSSDESAALRFASFLGSLRHSAERVDTILSINRDIWDSAFLPRLSGGLADRLSEVMIELEPLNREEMVALLDSRAVGLGERILARLDLSNGERHARGIIRAASDAWLKAARPVHPLEEPAREASPELPESVTLTPPAVAPAVQENPSPAVRVAEPAAAAVPVPVAAVTPPVEPPVPPPAPEAPPVWNPPAPEAPPAWDPPSIEPPPVPSPFQASIQQAAPPVQESVVESAPPHRDFLPPVEPVAESPAAAIPPLFEPVAEPVIQEQVPVGRIISEEELAGVSFQPVSAAAQAFEAPSTAPVQAVEAVAAAPVAAAQPPFQSEPVSWTPPPVVETSAAVWPAFGGQTPFQGVPAAQQASGHESPFQGAPQVQDRVGSASPFQTTQEAVEAVVVEPATALPQAAAFGAAAGFAPSPASATVSEPMAAPVEPKETDRVDELLRQFRERYARG